MPLNRIKTLLQQQKFREAIEAIDNCSAESLSEKAQLKILRTEAMLAIGEFDSTFVDVAIDILRPTNDIQLFAFAKYLKARIEIIDGALLDAIENLNEAYVYYKRTDDHRGMARSANLISYVYFLQSDFSAFEKNAERSIYHYKILKLNPQIGMVTINLAMSYIRTGQFHKAKKSLSVVNNEYLTFLSEDNLFNYYHVSAIYAIQSNDFKEAEEFLAKADKLSKDLKRELFRQYEISALLYITAKNHTKAEHFLNLGIELAEKIASKSTLASQIYRLQGDFYIGKKEFDLAQKSAKKALKIATNLNERIEMAACYRILAQVETFRNNEQKSLEWFDKALDLFGRINTRFELAQTRYLAAKIGFYKLNEKVAMLLMALEYFKSEELSYFEEKTIALLKELQPETDEAETKSNEDKAPLIITGSKKMLEKLEFARKVALSDFSVLITGETGTGKDLLAKYIHHYSGRPGKFVSINMAAIPNEMVEAELFGFAKGSYTGAVIDKPGLFEEADEGTLYLNEIADATPQLQAKLLEVLESREIRRLGENRSRKVSFRLISATNHNLKDKINENKFRADLFYRLNEIPIELMPLSQRREDIPLLTDHFLSINKYKVNGDQAKLNALYDLLKNHNWVGNVRQLKAELSNLNIVAGEEIDSILEEAQERFGNSPKERLRLLLIKNDWNQSEVARIVGTSESTIRRRIKEFGLSISQN